MTPGVVHLAPLFDGVVKTLHLLRCHKFSIIAKYLLYVAMIENFRVSNLIFFYLAISVFIGFYKFISFQVTTTGGKHLMTRQKVAVVTGGARGIGKAICDAFMARGDAVCTVDVLDNQYFVGDIAEEQVLREFAAKVIADHGSIDYLINNACLSRKGLTSCTYADFNYVLRVGVAAPFLLTQLLMDHFSASASVVNISSTRHLMSQANTESYSAAKGGITALTHAMAITLAGRARVNAISPGWIDTTGSQFAAADMLQHPVGRVGEPADIVHAVMFLCSDQSSFITGQNITVDGGMTKLMVYHNDHGWTYGP
jgi:NAD(P)-dependent dehydrogenase (short-subunit alcohol dehydrogenase family)